MERRSKRSTTKRQQQMLSNKRQSSSKVEYIKKWSDDEKKILLDLLYKHGDKDLDLLKANLPNKHISQVKTYLRTISRRAFLADKNRTNTKKILQLDKWIEHIKDSFQNEAYDDTVPFELFALAQEFNDPKKEFNEIIDFQKAFEYLYALTIGRNIEVDEKTHYFVHSYFDWFIHHYDKAVFPEQSVIFNSAIKRIRDTNLFPHEILNLIFPQVIVQEQFLSDKHLFKSICRRIKRTNFKRGDDYDRKISLLRAELDVSSGVSNVHEDSLPKIILPINNEVIFKNLPSFIWAALLNIDTAHLKDMST